jgi:hypothetical protein
MATASSGQATEEQTNFLRLAIMLVDMAPKVLRQVFDHYCPPANLLRHLQATPNAQTLNRLYQRKTITQPQWDTIFPLSGSPTSSTYDVTIFVLMLRNVCGVNPPRTGWDQMPPTSDVSQAADIVRIRRWRNELLAHAHKAETSNTSFTQLWKQVSEVILSPR